MFEQVALIRLHVKKSYLQIKLQHKKIGNLFNKNICLKFTPSRSCISGFSLCPPLLLPSIYSKLMSSYYQTILSIVMFEMFY